LGLAVALIARAGSPKRRYYHAGKIKHALAEQRIVSI
jgi:hypothetical protein